MTPDTEVWLTAARANASYHLIDGEWIKKSVCGRFIGREGRVDRGVIVYLAQAVELFASKPCKTCHGVTERVQPVVPVRQS